MNRSARRCLLALCVVASITTTRASSAQAPDPTLIPPRVVSEPPATYPDGASGAAEVMLEVVVGEDGAVTDVKLVEGTEPFASAAIAAANTYRFEPAARAGKPVRARIRVVIAFTPPPPPPAPEPEEPAPTPAAPTPSAAPSPPPPPAPIEEVRVLGRREPKSPTEHRLGRAEMRVVPGAFGDPFRAIDMLPSLVPIVSGLPYYYIRGAPPSAVGYYIDEVRVPYLFHFALGPGVIQPALVEEVALHPAAFPGRYGRYAGGIVAGTTREPAKELYGEGQIRLFDAGAYVEAPFAGGRATAGVGGRYSYTAGLVSLLAPEITIDYRDYNARVSYDISDRWRATAFTFGAFDYASQVEEGIEQVFFASEFHRLDLRLDRRGADGSASRVGATVGIDRTRLGGARFAQNIVTGVRGRHEQRVARDLDVEVGADVFIEHYSGDLPNPYSVSRRDYQQAVNVFGGHTDSASGAWVSASYRPAEGWDLTAAMRGDVFTSVGAIRVGPSPRVSMRVPLVAERLSFLGALGIAPQPPTFTIPVPAIGFRGLPGGLGYGFQKSAGVELKLPWRFTLKAVGFHHSYVDLRDIAQTGGDLGLDEAQLEPTSPSQAYGLELFLSRKLSERFAAFSSVNVSRSQLGSTRFVPSRLSPFDRSYVVQVGGVVELGRNWRASSRFLTYGGWPSDPPEARVPSGDRLPAFYRVDARIEKRWVWKEHRYIGLVFEGLNVTGSKEILSRECLPELGCKDREFGPLVIPSIGLEGGL